MKITDTSVKRPVFAIVINLLLLTFGLVAFSMLPLREYPDIETPIVSVSTDYTGASAEIIETKITQVLENRISGIEGIKSINSSSRNGRSNITIEFNISRDIDAASNDVRERVARALDSLPEQVRPPEVSNTLQETQKEPKTRPKRAQTEPQKNSKNAVYTFQKSFQKA